MAITFRHDAAAVVPPSNSSTRKYGQSLVLQQQQQKYAAQQAGYDRMFQAYRDENQNIAQQQRDWQQRDFVLNRDRDQNKLMQEQQRRADFANARQRMDAYAKETLNNPDLPPQLRNKIQNLIAGKMTVLGSDYNETQQQEFLDQYNAELAKLLSEAPVPKEPPTRDEQLRSFLGDSYEQYKDEPWVFDGKGGFTTDKNIQQRRQMEQKQEQDRLLKQQQELEQMRPKTMQEYYGKDDDKYRKDLRSTMDQMQKDYDIDPNSPKPTRENAVKKMQEDYDLSQRELGRSQYGEPTLAPPLPTAQVTDTPLAPANQPPTAQVTDTPLAPANQPPSPAQKTKLGDASNYPWLKDQSGNAYSVNTSSQKQQPAKAPAPDFTALAAAAQDDIDRALIHTLGNIYQTQPPDVQAAISKIIDPKASKDDARAAEAYLRSKGINVNQVITEAQGHFGAMSGTNRSLSGVR